jgi:hypothetical protein
MALKYVDQMAVKYLDQMAINKMYHHIPSQHPPKFIQTWIFYLKIYHLATLERTWDFLNKARRELFCGSELC